MRVFSVTLASLLMSSVAALGADVALVLGAEEYDHGRDLRSANEILDVVDDLQNAGFIVFQGQDLTSEAMRQRVTDFNTAADGTGRIVIALSGQFAGSGRDHWFLGIDADAPNIVSVPQAGISLDMLAGIAARAPGQAVILLGSEDAAFSLGRGLSLTQMEGFSLSDAPQGVSVIAGLSGDIAEFATEALLVPGQSPAVGLSAWPDLTGSGFIAPLVPFIDEGAEVSAAPAVDLGERALWEASKDIGTVGAFQTYLRRYPSGQFAGEARDQISRIESEPALQAEAAENAMGLSRDQRREIQRQLTLLDYDTRGIDGIFGRGTRAQIARWQGASGFQATGYLRPEELARLRNDSEIRSAQLEEEARQRKAELEAKDRAYWNATGAAGDEAGLRAYLVRYPDGIFAEIAEARLMPFESARRTQAREQDRAAWDAAKSAGTREDYQEYLQAYPDGAFVAEARTQIEQLRGDDAPEQDKARAEEEALQLNVGTKRLIEGRLAKLGLNPGRVDGNFSRDTRRAIRRYQEARDLPATGFVTQTTIIRLLADSVLR